MIPIIIPRASVLQWGAKRPLKAGTKAKPPELSTEEASWSVSLMDSSRPTDLSQFRADPATAIEPLRRVTKQFITN